VLPATSAVAALHSPRSQHGPAPVALAPLPVRNGSAHKIGPVSSAQTIRLTIGLRPPHMAAEQQFLREIQTKHSPLFHHYLTQAAWTARFGPSPAAQQAVLSWARGSGLNVTHLYPNRLVVDLSGRVGAVEKALGVQLSNYRLGTQSFFANNRVRCCRPRCRALCNRSRASTTCRPCILCRAACTSPPAARTLRAR
jgi:hypothetical protein